MASFTATVVLLLQAFAAAMAADESTKTSSDGPRPTTAATTTTAAAAATTTAGESKDVSILKQINRVNDDGSYTFGYEASDGSFKVETRDVAGNVKGMFGFVDEAGRLKRVSYSASNSSGFQATSREGSRKSREKNDDGGAGDYGNGGGGVYGGGGRHGVYGDGGGGGGGGGHGAYGNGDGKPSAVKKVLVSKRPVAQDEPADGRRGGYDLRRQLPKHGGGVDAPDVYGVHGRSGAGQQSVGPVSPVVSALMSELDPVVSSYHGPRQAAVPYEPIGRRAQEDDDDDGGGGDASATPQYHRAAPPVRYRQPVAAYPPVAAYQPVAVYQPVAGAAPYGAGLTALRDELMELILSFVQTRVAQLVSAAPYRYQPPLPVQPYPMPYQQPNYYVPSYYQGPRVSGLPQQDGSYVAGQQQPPARVTQTLKDGLIRMLLATSPRYDPDRIAGERAPRLTYRRPPQPTPVRNVQVIGDDGGGDRPVTTESPD